MPRLGRRAIGTRYASDPLGTPSAAAYALESAAGASTLAASVPGAAELILPKALSCGRIELPVARHRLDPVSCLMIANACA